MIGKTNFPVYVTCRTAASNEYHHDIRVFPGENEVELLSPAQSFLTVDHAVQLSEALLGAVRTLLEIQRYRGDL